MALNDTISALGNSIINLVGTRASRDLDNLSTTGVENIAAHVQDKLKDVNSLASSGTITLIDNSINKIEPTEAVTFNLPAVTSTDKFHQILVQLNLSIVVSIDVGTSYFFNSTAPDLSEAGVYNLIFEYDNANGYWVCGALSKGV